MSSEVPESRTRRLDQDVIEGLVRLETADTFDSLPEALTQKELSDIGIQVNLAAGDNEVSTGKRLERKALHAIGHTALNRGDLVTAQNSARELRREFPIGTILSLGLSYDIRKSKRAIVAQLTKSPIDD